MVMTTTSPDSLTTRSSKPPRHVALLKNFQTVAAAPHAQGDRKERPGAPCVKKGGTKPALLSSRFGNGKSQRRCPPGPPRQPGPPPRQTQLCQPRGPPHHRPVAQGPWCAETPTPINGFTSSSRSPVRAQKPGLCHKRSGEQREGGIK